MLPGRDSQQVGRVRVSSHRLQAQPEVGALQQHVDQHDGAGRQAPAAAGRSRDCGGKRRQPQRRGERAPSRTSRPRPGRFHGPKMSQRFRAVATKLSPRPPKISFTPPKVFSAPASIAQSAPPAMPATMLSGDDQRGIDTAALQAAQHPRGEDGPQGDLALDADVPQPDGEGDQQARGDQEQGHPGDQHVRRHVPGPHRPERRC